MSRADRRLEAKRQRRAITPRLRAHLMRQATFKQQSTAPIVLLDGHSEFTPEEQRAYIMPPRIALERFKSGQSEPQDFHELACAANILIICAEQISQEVAHIADQAAQALMRSLAREAQHGKRGLDGQGIAAITEALAIYDQLTQLITIAQFRAAMKKVYQRMQKGNAMSIKFESKNSTSPA